ncbi:hypothetical protein PQX77_016657 [Marasmius sp. AFHP31]|nr:hypothetical protein PQX77_016657 [Marasmius sp. AFHP31]
MIAQIWLILLEKDHVFTDSWSGLLLNFAVCDRDLPVSRRPAWDPTLPLPYEIDARLGRALLGHLGARTQRLRKMDASGLDRFKTFLLVLTTGNHCFQKPNPIYLGENYNATLGLMARILKILLCKRESLRVHPVDHEESFGVYGIVTAILIGFDEILLSSVRVQHVLDSGLIRTLYFGKECYAELDKRHRMSTSPRFRGAEIRVLNRISLFLVHPIVMRSLMRGIVYFPDVLAELSAQTGLDAAIVDAWVNLFRKAEELFKIRYTLKLRGLCNYLECPISSEEASEEHLNTRYMRCLGCTLSIYCSLGCRRADWKRGHKEECPTFAQTIRNGYPPVGPNDLWIFDALVKAYISLRAERFNTKIESFRSTMEVKTRNPVLHINFDQSHLPPTEDAEIMEMEVFASRLEGKDRRKGQFCDTLREAWYRTRSDQLLILAAFPVHYGQTSFPLDTVVPFPLRPNDVETDLYGWIRGD